jgi:hypothetical protein
MTGFARSFEEPDSTTSFTNGFENVVDLQGTPVGRMTIQPGWRWSNDVRPLMGTDLCPVRHRGYVLSGRLHVEMNDGSTLEVHGGDLYEIPPGHDAWVVGDDACTLLDWGGKVKEEYASPVDSGVGGAR